MISMIYFLVFKMILKVVVGQCFIRLVWVPNVQFVLQDYPKSQKTFDQHHDIKTKFNISVTKAKYT
jgi:hypothetical protein